MRIISILVFAVVFAVLPLAAWTTDNDGAQVQDGRRYYVSYTIPCLSSNGGIAQTAQQILIRSENNWPGGWLTVSALLADPIGQFVNIYVYNDCIVGCTNANGTTNKYYDNTYGVTSNRFVSNVTSATILVLPCTNTNTNGNNADVVNLIVNKPNRSLWTALGATNDAGGSFAGVTNIAKGAGVAQLCSKGTLVDTIKLTHSTTPYWVESQPYWLGSGMYMLLNVSNNVPAATDDRWITNVHLRLEFTRKK